MTGYGSRFVKAGYKHLKPFIKVAGKSMIEWIVSMYDQDSTEFIFICRSAHLVNDKDFHKLPFIAKHTKIVPIYDWIKLGPVNDFCKAYETGEIDKSLPTIINYCDFFCLWNSNEFIKECLERDVDGSIPCYTGFHPHLIPKRSFATIFRMEILVYKKLLGWKNTINGKTAFPSCLCKWQA